MYLGKSLANTAWKISRGFDRGAKARQSPGVHQEMLQSSRRAEKKAAVREALVVAADKLFEARGFEGTTVDDIAARAGVSRRTYFRYFATKEAIAFPRSADRLAAFDKLLREQGPEVPAFVAVTNACLQLGGTHWNDRGQELRRQQVIDASPTLMAGELEIFSLWEAAIAQRATPKNATMKQRRRAKIFAGATVGVVRAVLQEWFRSQGRKNIVTLGREAFGLLADGFADLD